MRRRILGIVSLATVAAGAPLTAVSSAQSAPPVIAAPATVAAVAMSSGTVVLTAMQAAPVNTAFCESAFGIACYEPSQLQLAYDENPLFNLGINGRGQTIAVVDAFGSPTIGHDLTTFDQTFGLPDPPSLRVIQPAGPVPPFDPSDPIRIGWASETTLDVEWAHAMAPRASILLVETPVAQTEGRAGFPEVVKAEDYVIAHHLATVISQSFNATEQTLQGRSALEPLRHAYKQAEHAGVTVLAVSGDTGAANVSNLAGTLLSTRPETNWPATDPLVTAVGGTQLHLDGSGHRTAPDTVWNDGNNPAVDLRFFGNTGPNALATGGGLSSFFARPEYQKDVARTVGWSRGVPDISMSAACDGAVDVYESFPGIGAGWYLICGTSEAVPLFAGVVALADQLAGHGLGVINCDVYAMADRRSGGIVDVTSGNNTVSFVQGGSLITVHGYAAGRGYDLASGLGTVDAARFVPDLVATDFFLTGGHSHQRDEDH